MIPELDGPVDLTPVRRASTAGSTGLDYSSCHRVDEDIISRIRSLILSRNDHRPPVTPHNSDEHCHSADIVLGFDFNSAKSVAKVARKDTGRTVAPDNRRRHRSSMPDMDGRRDTQPVLTLPVPPLRNIMSADDVNAPIISSSDTTPNNSKKKFRFPKLVLQDKKKRDAEIKSCFEAGRVPTNDAQIHEDELDCCPPCDPRDAKPSKYIVSHPTQPGPAVKIEPKDLACFLAGCPPGCTNCEKHGRRRHSVNFREDLFQQQRRMPTDLRAVGEELKRDVARMGLTIQGVPVRSTQVVDPTSNAFIQEKKAGESLGKSGAFSLAKEEKLRSRKPTKSPITISPASPISSGSMDAFPLAAHYMEQAALETQPRFTTTVATNFSLPGYKDKGKSKRASAILRKKLSDSSLLSKGKASSQSRSIDEVAFPRESREVPAPATIPEDESEYPSESNKLWPKDELFSPIAYVPITETELDQVDTPNQPSKMNGPASKDQLASFTVGAPPADTETDQEDIPGQSTSKKSSVKSVKTSLDPFIDQLISSPPTETSLSSTKPIASDSIRARASEASMKSKSYTPSILSGASRTSAARHALLKPSVTVFQPVDLGLPLPPVLTPLPLEVSVQKQLGFEIATSDDQGIPQPDQTTDAKASFDGPEENKINSNEPRTPQASQPKDSKPPFEDDAAGNNVKPNEQAFPVVKNHAKPTLSTSAKDHLMNLQKARELVDSVKGQIRQVEEQMLKSIEEQSVKSPSDRTSKDPRGVNASKKPSSSKKGKKSAFTSPISHALVDCQSPTEEKGVDLFKTPSSAVGTLFQDLSKLAELKSDSPIDSPTALRPSDAEPIVSRPVDAEQVTVKPLDAAPVVPGSGGACLVNAGLVGAELVASVPVTAGVLDAGPANVGLVGAEPVAPVPIAASSLEPGPTTAVPLDTGTIEAKQAPPSPASLNAAYWGFVPAVKEAVQDAIGIAVRNAVQDIVVPPGTEQDEASDAYRKLMADSLAQAARRADEYLRRASLWNNPPSTPRDSEATVVFTARPSIVDQRPTSVVGKPTTEPQRQMSPVGGSYGRESRRPSVASKNQENEATQPGDKSAGSAVSPSISGRYGPIGSVPANFQSRQDLTLPPGVTTSGELETIPLETDDKFGSQEGVPGWKLSKAFKKGYTPIPTRQSSRNRVLSPKTLATNSVSKFSPQGTVDTPVRKRSFERLVSRAGRGLRSISSAGSLRSAVSDKKYQAEALVPPKPGSPPAKDSKVINTMPKSRKLSRKSTVHWLRDLLSNNGPYETRFTALPPRTRRDYEALNKTPRSQTAPVAPISNLFLGKTPVPLPPPKAAASKGKRTKRADPSETFSKTINDLENLMNEALLIARQAADSQDPKYPSILGSAVKVLKGNRKVETDAQLNARLEQDRKQSRISMLRCSGSGSGSDTAPSVHESLLSYSDSSDSDFENEEEIDEPPPKRSIMVASINDPPKRSSGWPPTGRVSTPFPPASISPSRESPLADSPSSTDKKFSSATADRLHSADPRSLPTEIDVELRRQITAPLQSGNELTMLKRTAARKMSVFVPQDLQAISSSEHSPFEILKPEFILEPFSRSRTEREGAEESRKSSAKSPKRLSPTRKSNVDQAVPNSPTANKCEDVVLDLCGDPCPPRAKTVPLPKSTPQGGSLSLQPGHEHSSEQHQAVTTKLALKSVPSKREVRDFIMERYHPPITPRSSSLALRKQAEQQQSNSNANVNVTSKSGQTGVTGLTGATGRTYDWQNLPSSKMQSLPPPPETRAMTSGRDTIERFMEPDRSRQGASHSFDGSLAEHSEVLDFEVGYGVRQRSGAYGEAGGSRPLQAIELQDKVDPNLPPTSRPERDGKKKHVFSLGGKRHLSLRSQHLKGFSFTRSHKRQAIARDWSPGRKRFVASVSCISTALIGILVGVYAGETPAIQYYIVDFHHYTVLGNVFFFIGLAVPTFLFWPLPLLHGRKPYILGAMSLAMPLLFPQALAVGEFRSPYVSTWRVGLILSRALMGFCLGFANMNFKAMLTDLFGASLQSQNPHQEHVDEFDVRRHGGGMGAWLGLWTWCAVGSVGFGFMIGAVIINHLPPTWGFYASIAIIAFVMLLNVLCPEVRRSAFRRSVAEVVKENAVSRRLARGEVKMHMVQSGPKWWGEEFHYGVQLSKNMLRQPGFLIMALYYSWIYGQMVLIISLLGALMSKDYKMKSPYVGASVTSLPLGALLAIPFQKASFLSRARNKIITSDDQTLKKKFSWSSHMLRRSIFILCLPIAGMAYTLSSHGPPIPFILPIIFAGIIGFLSSLALAECSGIIMETFDTSDLQPGMTGRPRGSSGDKTAAKRTNYSSFPRVQSAFAMTSGFGYLIAAAASGVGGSLTRHLGQQAATGIMAGILLALSLLLLASLIRFTDVQIIPDSKKDEMDRYHQARRASAYRREEGMEEEEPWRPVIIGNPHHHTRRMCLLELGSMSRFSEIRRKNKLVDKKSLEAKHPNRAAMEDVRQYIETKERELRHKVSQSLSRHGSRGSRTSRLSDGPEQGDLGGHREMLARGGSGKGSRRGAPGSGRKGTSMARKEIKEDE